jgi:hypothetical protein
MVVGFPGASFELDRPVFEHLSGRQITKYQTHVYKCIPRIYFLVEETTMKCVWYIWWNHLADIKYVELCVTLWALMDAVNVNHYTAILFHYNSGIILVVFLVMFLRFKQKREQSMTEGNWHSVLFWTLSIILIFKRSTPFWELALFSSPG